MSKLVLLLAALSLWQCGVEPQIQTLAKSGSVAMAYSPVDECIAVWNPIWQQTSGANEWWVEFRIGDGEVVSAYLEVMGRGDVPLSYAWQRWVGPTGFRVPRGSQVILHAQSSSRQAAQTHRFAYLLDEQPVTNPCAGTCASGWRPSLVQAAGANEWWVEYRIADDIDAVTAVSLEVLGVGNVALSYNWNKWVGAPSTRIGTGSFVVVHLENAIRQKAQTRPFRYLVDTTPAIRPCPSECPTDWRPAFAQAPGANEWWIEYSIDDTSVTAAALAILGGASIPLSSRWNKWAGPTDMRIPAGTPVSIRAESSTGKVAQTVVFAYLHETEPALDPCATFIDLDVTYIGRSPAYRRYEVEYTPPGYNPHLRAGTEDLKRWPDPGELVTFTAHIINKGAAPSASFAGRWFIDDQPSGGVFRAGLEPGEEAMLEVPWVWKDGHHVVRFELRAADGTAPWRDVFAVNDRLSMATDAWTFSIRVWQSWYDYYNANPNVVGTHSFEDWLQFQASEMSRLFAETRYPFAPDGLHLHITIDRIEVFPDDTPDFDGNLYEPNLYRDGNWPFSTTWSGWKDHARAVLGRRDDVTMHEWGHQIGLFDVYQMDVQDTDVQITEGEPRVRMWSNSSAGPDFRRLFDGDTRTLIATYESRPVDFVVEFAEPVALYQSRANFDIGYVHRWTLFAADSFDGVFSPGATLMSPNEVVGGGWGTSALSPVQPFRFCRLHVERLDGDRMTHVMEWELFGEGGRIDMAELLREGLVAGTDKMPRIAWDVVHYNTIAPDLMGGGIPFVLHEYTARALQLQTNWNDRRMPRRRGHFGDYLMFIPAENDLLVRAANGAPLVQATVEVFQMQDGVIPNIAKFVGRTGADGRWSFPHQTTPEYAARYGGPPAGLGVLNPWSTVYSDYPNVVGTNAVFVLRIESAGGEDQYIFLETPAFNMAYFEGHTQFAEYLVETELLD